MKVSQPRIDQIPRELVFMAFFSRVLSTWFLTHPIQNGFILKRWQVIENSVVQGKCNPSFSLENASVSNVITVLTANVWP